MPSFRLPGDSLLRIKSEVRPQGDDYRDYYIEYSRAARCQDVRADDRNVRISLRRIIRRLKRVGLQNPSGSPARREITVLPLLPVAGIDILEVGHPGIAVAFGLIILASDRMRSGRAR